MVEVKAEGADHGKRHVRVGGRRLRKIDACLANRRLDVAEPAVEVTSENFRIGQLSGGREERTRLTNTTEPQKASPPPRRLNVEMCADDVQRRFVPVRVPDADARGDGDPTLMFERKLDRREIG